MTPLSATNKQGLVFGNRESDASEVCRRSSWSSKVTDAGPQAKPAGRDVPPFVLLRCRIKSVLCAILVVLTSLAQDAAAVVVGFDTMRPVSSYDENSSVRQLGRAVGQLQMLKADGALYVCTAFLIADNVAITARSCVDNDVTSISLVMGYVEADSRLNSPGYRAMVLEKFEHFAVLKVEDSPGLTWGKLRLARSLPEAELALVVLHYPSGQPLTVSSACRLLKVTEVEIDHDCDTLGGTSGAPIFDAQTGTVVGMHSKGPSPGSSGSSFNSGYVSTAILNESAVSSASATLQWIDPVSRKLIVPDAKGDESLSNRGLKPIVVRDKQGYTVMEYAQSYALLIGASKYTNGWSTLRHVPDDIEAVQKSLKKQGFETIVVMDPSRDTLRASIEDFVFNYGTNQDNRLLVYFAGHGASLAVGDDRMMGYIVLSEAPRPDADRVGFKRNSLSMSSFETFAKDIQSRHALFVFDSCFAGSVFSSFRGFPPAAIERKMSNSVRQFITSGTADQEVPDDSIFRRQFVFGLDGDADLNKDGYVTGSELGYFLEVEVTNLSQGVQTPVYGKMLDPDLQRGDFIFRPTGRD